MNSTQFVTSKSESEHVHQVFVVDVVALKLLHEVNQFDISLADKISALRVVISFLLRRFN
ncbi:MAG: hypothetical protein WC856_26430 [Methylococcaceae bacterium]|jgi:hypothetical protein